MPLQKLKVTPPSSLKIVIKNLREIKWKIKIASKEHTLCQVNEKHT